MNSLKKAAGICALIGALNGCDYVKDAYYGYNREVTMTGKPIIVCVENIPLSFSINDSAPVDGMMSRLYLILEEESGDSYELINISSHPSDIETMEALIQSEIDDGDNDSIEVICRRQHYEEGYTHYWIREIKINGITLR